MDRPTRQGQKQLAPSIPNTTSLIATYRDHPPARATRSLGVSVHLMTAQWGEADARSPLGGQCKMDEWVLPQRS
jgi:hypothetical protein